MTDDGPAIPLVHRCGHHGPYAAHLVQPVGLRAHPLLLRGYDVALLWTAGSHP